MNKKEFLSYVDYIEKVFNTKINRDTDVLATYYKSFENINPIIAKEMAEKYLVTETGYFKWAKLLEYKTVCLKGKEWHEEAINSKCILCNNTGYVFVEEKRNGRIYEFAQRCTCSIGNSMWSKVKQIDKNILNTHYQDYKGVFRLEKKEVPIVENNVLNAVKERMGVV